MFDRYLLNVKRLTYKETYEGYLMVAIIMIMLNIFMPESRFFSPQLFCYFSCQYCPQKEKKKVTFLWAYYRDSELAIASGNKPDSFSYQTDLGLLALGCSWTGIEVCRGSKEKGLLPGVHR